MGTSWKTKTVSEQFNEYNDILENLLGYHYLFNILNCTAQNDTILDYGCGPGKVSLRLAETMDRNIIAVDESENMLNIARTIRNNEKIQYHLIENDRLPFVKDNSLDAAITCFVFINNEKPERIRNIMKEIYRGLKPGGMFLILDSNPRATGIDFTTFSNGQAGKQYYDGEPKQQFLHIVNQDDLVLDDFYWSEEFYRDGLKKAGFSDVTSLEPKIEDFSVEMQNNVISKYNLKKEGGEYSNAPFIILKAIKK